MEEKKQKLVEDLKDLLQDGKTRKTAEYTAMGIAAAAMLSLVTDGIFRSPTTHTLLSITVTLLSTIVFIKTYIAFLSDIPADKEKK